MPISFQVFLFLEKARNQSHLKFIYLTKNYIKIQINFGKVLPRFIIGSNIT